MHIRSGPGEPAAEVASYAACSVDRDSHISLLSATGFPWVSTISYSAFLVVLATVELRQR